MTALSCKTFGMVRARYGVAFGFSHLTVNPTIWDEVFSLATFEIPVWDDLRLDAVNALPSIGTAIVLAYASLETFIARVLDDLAVRSSIPPTLWS